MSRRPSMSPTAQVRAQRRKLRQLMQDVAEFARQKKAEAIEEGLFDPAPATGGRVLEAHIAGGEIIVDGPPAPTRRR
jgi:hypothetical protein